MLSSGQAAWAQQRRAAAPMPPKIIVLTLSQADERWPEAEQRLIAELKLLDLELIVLPAQSDQAAARQEEMDAQINAHQASAAIFVSRPPSSQGGKLHIWINDAITNKIVLRRIELDPTLSRPEQEAALMAVELLRASLLELSLTPQRPRAPQIDRIIEPSPKPLSAPPQERERLQLTTHSGVIGGSGQLKPSLWSELGVTLPLLNALGLGVKLAMTPTTSALGPDAAPVKLYAASAQLYAPHMLTPSQQLALHAGLGTMVFKSLDTQDLAQGVTVDVALSYEYWLLKPLALSAKSGLIFSADAITPRNNAQTLNAPLRPAWTIALGLSWRWSSPP